MHNRGRRRHSESVQVANLAESAIERLIEETEKRVIRIASNHTAALSIPEVAPLGQATGRIMQRIGRHLAWWGECPEAIQLVQQWEAEGVDVLALKDLMMRFASFGATEETAAPN